jgi:hypothetical protein
MIMRDKSFGADYSRGVSSGDAVTDEQGRIYDIAEGLHKSRDSEDDRMSGGVSLAQGSDAYVEYVEERQGMDEFERDRAEKSRDGFGSKGDLEVPDFDEFHERRYHSLSKQDADRLAREDVVHRNGRRMVRDVEAYRVIKGRQAQAIIDHAQRMSAGTPSVVDDEFVSDDLGGIMESMVDDPTRRTLDGEAAKTQKIMDDLSMQ